MSRALNTQRVGWAAAGLTVFQRTTREFDIETSIVDLIADLGHLAKTHTLDFIEILRRGIRAWAYEKCDLNELGASPSVSIGIGPIHNRPRSMSRSVKGGAA